MYIEALTAEQRLAEPDDVAVYVRAFDLLRAAAVTGQDAVALIQRDRALSEAREGRRHGLRRAKPRAAGHPTADAPAERAVYRDSVTHRYIFRCRA